MDRCLSPGRLLAAGFTAFLLGCGGGGAEVVPGPPAEPPRITVQPQGATLTEPAPFTLAVTATGTAPLTYQWKKDGAVLAGATGASFGVSLSAPEDSGSYLVEVLNSTFQKAVSDPAVVLIRAATGPPQFIVQPQSITVTAPALVTLSARAIGTRPIAYQWRRNGGAIAGATGATYSFQASTTADGGAFTVAASNGLQPDAVSAVAQVTVNAHAGQGTFQDVGPLAYARAQHTATLLPSGKVLVAGGNGGAGPLDRAETFDPVQGSFTTLAGGMASARAGHTATLLGDGTVLLAGGAGNFGVLASAEIFHPDTGTFTPLAATLSTGRANHSAVLLGSGKVLLVGGQGAAGDLASAELYDPVARTFAPAGNLAVARSGCSATLLGNGQVLVAGGTSNGLPLDQAELYQPTAPTASAFLLLPARMTAARSFHAAALVGTRVLLCGGTGAFGVLATAELFDPALGQFAATGSLAAARGSSTASVLGDGTVLVVGGLGPAGPLASAELYAPAGGTFTTTTSSLSAARSGHTASVLAPGKVLIVGGTGAAGPLAVASVYQ